MLSWRKVLNLMCYRFPSVLVCFGSSVEGGGRGAGLWLSEWIITTHGKSEHGGNEREAERSVILRSPRVSKN